MKSVWGILGFMLILTAGVPGRVNAQYFSDNGLFEVDYNRGCPGTTIQITNLYTATCDCLAGCACDYDYDGDGIYDNIATPFEYTYTDEGVYRLEILFGGTPDFIEITIEDKPAPQFNAYLCAASTVQVDIPDTEYEGYEIDFGDGTVVTINQGDPVPSHTYPDNSPRTISVRGIDSGSANNCPVSTQNIAPRAALPAPSVNSITGIDPSAVALGFTTEEGILYELQMSANNGAYSTLSTYSNALTSVEVNNLDLVNNYYCFQLVAMDPCGGPSVVSNTVCSIQLNATEGNSSANLSWQTGNYDSDVTIYINGQLLTTEPNGTDEYLVNNLICGTEYCFEVSVFFGSAISTSIPACVDGNSQTGPPPINNISTVITGTGDVNLQWYIDSPVVQPAVYQGFELYRYAVGTLPQIIADVTTVQYLDQEVNIPELTNYCYEVVPRDYCDNRTPANIVACLILLDGTITPSDEVTLNWNSYMGYSNGVNEYIVEKSYGGALSELIRVQDTTFTEVDTNPDSQVITYRITAVPNDANLRSSVSHVITLYKSNNLFFPDAFTPDGDGLNDLFEVNARFITDYELMIFNRWGEMIFHSNDISETWNGQLNGTDLQEGAYAIKVRLTDESGREIRKEGSITLVRR